MAKGGKRKDSEFQSYVYIKNELKDLGWNVKNPERDREGQLYTQNECLHNPDIKSMLNRDRPEYVIKLKEDSYWVLEAKAEHKEIGLAYKEAVTYGKKINQSKIIKAKIVSGVAGNDEDTYLIKSGYWNAETNEFDLIRYNDKEITGLISPDNAKTLLSADSPILKDYEIFEEDLSKIADEINQIFYDASVDKDKRAPIIASILLSLMGETEPQYNASPNIFVNDINKRAEEILQKNDKGEYYKHVIIQLPEGKDAQLKFKEALVKVFFKLKHGNMISAMNSGTDILGKFYEGFLKYGNGAKDLGIVFTPRHITKFSAEVLNLTHKDIVYDPTCGTGGFLVSAFNCVKYKSSKDQLDRFRLNKIFGIEQKPVITALAIVNMIFRGDGKNNIINDDCLPRGLIPKIRDGVPSAKFVSKDEARKNKTKPVTKVLMNPPFAQKEKEYEFVQHALEQMEDGGLLFAVLPISIMIKQGQQKQWRKSLVKNNTLLSVITFPPDLFYPVNQLTLGIFVKKGIPQPKDQKVLWIRAIHDGFTIKKSKRIPNPKIEDDFVKIKNLVTNFLNNPSTAVTNIPQFQKSSVIDFKDSSFELVPEAYIDQRIPSSDEIEKGMEELIRESVAYMIRSGKEPDNDS